MYKIQEKDISNVSRTLATAFEHDPIWEKILGGCTKEQKNAWFQCPVRYCMMFGDAVAPSAETEGFIGWLHNEYSEMTFSRMLKCGAVRYAKKAGSKPTRRMMPLRVFDKKRKKHMAGRDFIYVMIVGVNPNLQGQGFGGKLIRYVVTESENEGLPIYLETSTEKNVAMYEYFGFKVIDKIMIPKLNLLQWILLREPNHSILQL